MAFSAITLFCDDIRYEYDGKETLVGVYQAAYQAPDFPLHIHNLYAVTTIRFTEGDAPENLQIETHLLENAPAIWKMPDADAAQAKGEARDNDAPDDSLQFRMVARLPNFTVPHPGPLIVRVRSGGTLLPSGALTFRHEDEMAHDDGPA